MGKKLNSVQIASAIFWRAKGKESFRSIAKRCSVSKSSAHRVWRDREWLMNPTKKHDFKPAKKKTGPKPRLGPREKRLLMRTVKRLRRGNVNFNTPSLIEAAGLWGKVKPRTVSRYLNNAGYHFLQARKKGLLTDEDKIKRVQYANRMGRVLKSEPEFYTQTIAFYLDGVSFVHKFNPLNDAQRPRTRVWRKKGEGLNITSKGSKDLAGGRRIHLMVAIAYGKGIILCKPYTKMDGHFFASFIRRHFNLTFGKAGIKSGGQRIFIMDNDPSQTSRVAIDALRGIEAEHHVIPARSPDLNPIENVFHLVKKKLQVQAESLGIISESFEEFQSRVIACCYSIDPEVIDKTISSMPKRIHCIISCKGSRTKY